MNRLTPPGRSSSLRAATTSVSLPTSGRLLACRVLRIGPISTPTPASPPPTTTRWGLSTLHTPAIARPAISPTRIRTRATAGSAAQSINVRRVSSRPASRDAAASTAGMLV
jgi:hypothetical protein